MSELDQTNEPSDEISFVTEDEYATLRTLFAKGDTEASIEGEFLVLLALVDEAYRQRFARVSLPSLVRSTAYMMQEMDRQEELLALMGLFGKMQMIVAEYVDAKGESGFVEVIDEDEHLEELERYRNPLA